MTKLKIISIGESSGVLLPEEFLTKLELGLGDIIYASETENGIALTAYDPEFDAQMAIAEDIMAENDALLEKLAKA